MKAVRYSMVAFLSLGAVFMVGCGDEQDKRLSNADVACLKLLQAGQQCAPGAGGSGTTTVTATSTITVTNTTVK